jgi:hypothetical protein
MKRSKKTNKTTLRSEWRGAGKKKEKRLDRADIVRDVRLIARYRALRFGGRNRNKV